MKIKKNKIKEILEGLKKNDEEEINEGVRVKSDVAKAAYLAFYILAFGKMSTEVGDAEMNRVEVEFFGYKEYEIVMNNWDVEDAQRDTVSFNIQSGDTFAGRFESGDDYKDIDFNSTIREMAKKVGVKL